MPQSLIYDILFLTNSKRPTHTEKETVMQFILLPFALCFLLYIHQENRYRFWAATALKVTLTLTLALCLLVALLRRYSPVLLAANLGMVPEVIISCNTSAAAPVNSPAASCFSAWAMCAIWRPCSSWPLFARALWRCWQACWLWPWPSRG